MFALSSLYRVGTGPARAAPLFPRLRDSLDSKRAQIKPKRPNSARPGAVQPLSARARDATMFLANV